MWVHVLTTWWLMASSESQVQYTNDRATLSKCSTSQAGYFCDPFVSMFVTHCPHRAPIIHWGYWIRNQAMEWTVNHFLNNHTGAGFDTLYFKLTSQDKLTNSLYIEVDFPEVVSRKTAIISTHPSLSHGDNFKLIGCDITHLDELERELLLVEKIDRHAPTLILSEVALIYIQPQKVNKVLSWLAGFFPNSMLCTYDQILPADGFGRVMLKHFESLSSPLLNIEQYPNQRDNQQRLTHTCGWSDAVSCDMNEFYSHLPTKVMGKTLSLEPFDEFEEWHLMCAHYQLLCAFNGDCCKAKNTLCPPLQNMEESNTDTINGTICKWKAIGGHEAWELSRFGHALVEVEGSFLIYGGFGISGPSLSQSRLVSLVSINIESRDEWQIKEVAANGDGCHPGPLMHHTLTCLPSGNVLLIGGRGSPNKPNPHLYLLHRETMDEWNWERLTPSISLDGAAFEGRWRHTANVVEGVVLIIGGRGKDERALNEIWKLTTDDWKLEQLEVFLPVGAHSHTAVTNGSEIFILGGLDSDLRPLNTSLRLFMDDQNNWRIEKLSLTPPLPPRYSMTGHIIAKDKLILVGGVQLRNSQPAPIILVNLNTSTWTGIDIEYSSPSPPPPLILHNHVSFIDRQQFYRGLESSDPGNRATGMLTIAGGGGNFFSFGTHFNKTLSITINDNDL